MKHQPTKAKRRETPERRAITRAGIKRPTDTGETLDHIAAKPAADAGVVRKHAAAGAVVNLKSTASAWLRTCSSGECRATT